jgi:hypothetical protein
MTGAERGAAADCPAGRGRGRSHGAAAAAAMVITSPEPVRARFRGQSTRAMVTTAAGLRPGASSGDIEVLTALTVLRDLARRIRFLEAKALRHERGLPGDRAVLAAGLARPDRGRPDRGGHRAHRLVPSGWLPRQTRRSRCSPAPPRSRHLRARPSATGSTAPATANSTAPCTPWPSAARSETYGLAPTPIAAAHKAEPTGRSNAASSATSPRSSTDASNHHRWRLDAS